VQLDHSYARSAPVPEEEVEEEEEDVTDEPEEESALGMHLHPND